MPTQFSPTPSKLALVSTQTWEEFPHLWAVLRDRLFGLLQAAGVAGLRVDGAAVQVVRAGGQHGINIRGIGECDEPETPRAARLGVLHSVHQSILVKLELIFSIAKFSN